MSYPASSLPAEILLSAPTIASSYGNQSDAGSQEQEHKEVSNVYMVRDRDHICDLHLSSASLRPGRDVEVHLDFTDSLQPCSMVRATVVLSEVRPDGSRIQVTFCVLASAVDALHHVRDYSDIQFFQDKVVSKAIRTATDAEYLNMTLNIPSELSCSFDTPLFTVSGSLLFCCRCVSPRLTLAYCRWNIASTWTFAWTGGASTRRSKSG